MTIGYAELLKDARAIADIWSWRGKWLRARKIWISVLKHQEELGAFDHDLGSWPAYADAMPILNEDAVRSIERRTRHDVMAHIEYFNTLVPVLSSGRIHVGLTSADIVDNVALMQMNDTNRALEGMHWLFNYNRMPFRGLKGAIGTQQDLLDMVGTPERVATLETAVAHDLGWEPSEILNSVGQVYPRSLDLSWASALMSNIRVEPWLSLGRGFLSMISGYSGGQWNEGDVSTSVVRRVALPAMAATTYHALKAQQTTTPTPTQE